MQFVFIIKQHFIQDLQEIKLILRLRTFYNEFPVVATVWVRLRAVSTILL